MLSLWFATGFFAGGSDGAATELRGRPRWRNRTRGKTIEETLREFLQERVDSKKEAEEAAHAYLVGILDQSAAEVRAELATVNRALHRMAKTNDTLMVAAMDLEITRMKRKVREIEERADEEDLEAILMIL